MSRIVEVSERRVYHKFVKMEVEVPDNIRDDEVSKWLLDNNLWEAEQDVMFDRVEEYELGNGAYDYDGMSEPDTEYSETRYDIYTTKVQTYGGHL